MSALALSALALPAFGVLRFRGRRSGLFPDATTLGSRSGFVLISVLSFHYEAGMVFLRTLRVNNEWARDTMAGEKYDSGARETVLMHVFALPSWKDISGLVIGEAG